MLEAAFESAPRVTCSGRMEPEQALPSSLRTWAARERTSPGARMCAQRGDRRGVEWLSSELQDGCSLQYLTLPHGRGVGHISESASRAPSLGTGATRIGNGSTWGRSPMSIAALESPFVLRFPYVGTTLSRRDAVAEAAAPARAELSVRQAAVRVQYVDAWPQRRRAHGSPRRQHTIDDDSKKVSRGGPFPDLDLRTARNVATLRRDAEPPLHL
jgi:hypothetical protein